MFKRKPVQLLLVPARFVCALPARGTAQELSEAVEVYFSDVRLTRMATEELVRRIEQEILAGNVPHPLRSRLREFVWTEGPRLLDETSARRMVGLPEIH